MAEAERRTRYNELLGVPNQIRDPDYYQLLGLDRGAFDPGVVEARFKERMSTLQAIKSPKHKSFIEFLKGELRQARTVLCDPRRRGEYDAELLAERHEQLARILDVVLSDGLLTAAEEERLQSVAEEVGLFPHELAALLARELAARGARREADAWGPAASPQAAPGPGGHAAPAAGGAAGALARRPDPRRPASTSDIHEAISRRLAQPRPPAATGGIGGEGARGAGRQAAAGPAAGRQAPPRGPGAVAPRAGGPALPSPPLFGDDVEAELVAELVEPEVVAELVEPEVVAELVEPEVVAELVEPAGPRAPPSPPRPARGAAPPAGAQAPGRAAKPGPGKPPAPGPAAPGTWWAPPSAPAPVANGGAPEQAGGTAGWGQAARVRTAGVCSACLAAVDEGALAAGKAERRDDGRLHCPACVNRLVAGLICGSCYQRITRTDMKSGALQVVAGRVFHRHCPRNHA